MRFTDAQYQKAIDHLEAARTQLEPNGNGCHCCGGSGHQAFECGHNPLVAMAMCEGIAKRSDTLHDYLHLVGDDPPLTDACAALERLHDFMHTLSGACTYMGVQSGPARVHLPDGAT
jgi:hypothetical protein